MQVTKQPMNALREWNNDGLKKLVYSSCSHPCMVSVASFAVGRIVTSEIAMVIKCGRREREELKLMATCSALLKTCRNYNSIQLVEFNEMNIRVGRG